VLGLGKKDVKKSTKRRARNGEGRVDNVVEQVARKIQMYTLFPPSTHYHAPPTHASVCLSLIQIKIPNKKKSIPARASKQNHHNHNTRLDKTRQNHHNHDKTITTRYIIYSQTPNNCLPWLNQPYTCIGLSLSLVGGYTKTILRSLCLDLSRVLLSLAAVLSYVLSPCLVLSYPVLSCLILSCLVLSCPVLSYLVLSCLVLSSLLLSLDYCVPSMSVLLLSYVFKTKQSRDWLLNVKTLKPFLSWNAIYNLHL
jgi:hypothetical protein